FALVVAGVFYQTVAGASRAPKPQKIETKEVVVAVRALPVGVNIKPEDVKLAKLPAAQIPPGTFSRPEEVYERPVISSILPDEPIREGRIGARGSGLGLAPVIPPGMRAVAVRVNDVVGVAGFVLPGMRVDVLVTGRPPNHPDTMTTTVLQNILVLSAGQKIEPDARGQAINSPVVTLLVTPEQAEILTLAGNEGKIQLVLRNASDQSIQKTPGRLLTELYPVRKSPAEAPAVVHSRPARVESRPEAPPAPPPPPPEEIVVFRGSQRSVEVVGTGRQPASGSQP
ncbi:MAG: Flp pilus assembly protein CpaB, partial [Bryobacteraceae bacterium]